MPFATWLPTRSAFNQFAEIEAVISANNGVVDRSALRKMTKTDSFFKGSMRGTPPRKYITTFHLSPALNSCKVGFSRKILKSVTLSDGTRLL